MTQSMTLVGRDHEIAQLRSAVDSARSGKSAFVNVMARGGMGKSVLLDELESYASTRGMITLRARGTRAEHSFAYACLIQLLETELKSGSVFNTLEPADAAALAAVIPALRTDQRTEDLTTFALCRSVFHVFEQLAKSSGLVVIVDDAQWADERSLVVLSYALRHGIASDFVTAVAQRPSAALGLALDDIAAEFTSYLNLQPLNDQDAQRLVSDLPLDIHNAALAAAGGNPFFLTQLAAHPDLIPTASDSSTATSSDLPPAITSSILTELSATSPMAQNLLRAAAVLGEPSGINDAANVAQLELTQALSAIDELENVGLIKAGSTEPSTLCFRHPIIGTVVYKSLPPGTLIGLHRQAVAVLSARHASPLKVALHLQHCAAAGDLQAIEQLMDGATEAAELAPATAARLLQLARNLLPASHEISPLAGTIIARRVQALWRCGRLSEALDEAIEAFDALPSDATTERAMLAAMVLRAQVWSGVTLDKPLQLEPLLKVSEADLEVRLILQAFLAHDLADKGQLDAARELQQSMIEQAHPAGPKFYLLAIISAAREECSYGSIERAREHLTVARTIQVPANDRGACVDSVLMMLSLEQWVEEHERVLAQAADLRKVVSSSGIVIASSFLALMTGGSLTELGQLTAAAAALEGAEAEARLVNYTEVIALALATRAIVETMRSQTREAAKLLTQAQSAACGSTSESVTNVLGLAHAYVMTQLGRPEEVRTALLEAGGGPDLPNFFRVSRGRVLKLLTEAEIALGNIVAAARWANKAIELASTDGLNSTGVEAFLAAGTVAFTESKTTQALAYADEALRYAERSRNPVNDARAQILRAQILIAANQSEPAQQAASDALVALEGTGAELFAAQARQLLRSLGVSASTRRTRRSDKYSSELTDREAQIAQLVSDGLNNDEIAARLFLSKRTVETHLRRIYAKRNITHRGQLIAEISAQD